MGCNICSEQKRAGRMFDRLQKQRSRDCQHLNFQVRGQAMFEEQRLLLFKYDAGKAFSRALQTPCESSLVRRTERKNPVARPWSKF